MPLMKTLKLGNTVYTISGGGGSLPAGYAYADSIPENADHSIKYILPDGYIWEWSDSETTVVVPYNAATGGLLNKVPVLNQSVETTGDKAGAFLSAPIPWDSSWTQYEKTPTVVRITGNKTLSPIWYNSAIQVFYYKANGDFKFSLNQSAIHSFVGGPPALGASIPLPCEFNLADNNFYPLEGTGYVRIYLGISSDGSITANDVNDIVINVPFYDTEETVSGGSWVNTGVKYTPGDSGDVTDLTLRVDDLEDDVETLSSSVTNLQSKVNIKDEGKILIAVGDSITRGAVAGGPDYAWPKHVIDINGYDAVNSLNLGQNGLGFDTAATGSGDTVKAIVDRTDFSGADIVTVALGCNDWKNSNALLTNVWANMEYCFNKIRTDNPYCKLFYILPFNMSFMGTFATFYCLSGKGDSNPLCPYSYTLMQYINMIKDKLEESTFKAFRIQTIDMVECPAINRHNILTALADQVHPTAATQRKLGEEIARRIMLADGAR